MSSFIRSLTWQRQPWSCEHPDCRVLDYVFVLLAAHIFSMSSHL